MIGIGFLYTCNKWGVFVVRSKFFFLLKTKPIKYVSNSTFIRGQQYSRILVGMGGILSKIYILYYIFGALKSFHPGISRQMKKSFGVRTSRWKHIFPILKVVRSERNHRLKRLSLVVQINSQLYSELVSHDRQKCLLRQYRSIVGVEWIIYQLRTEESYGRKILPISLFSVTLHCCFQIPLLGPCGDPRTKQSTYHVYRPDELCYPRLQYEGDKGRWNVSKS